VIEVDDIYGRGACGEATPGLGSPNEVRLIAELCFRFNFARILLRPHPTDATPTPDVG